ncbi:hypothetical protein K461DRAFT_268264 [Myriangium duriaei CBS 260.36]|uniref:Cyanovirin-N domain-containing protein n=1 Tax=Myriangium duriaei CBS 260.36 TaxID=1168546 RepID=A0A9P4MM20_9PEZI|nr:hypothetical protein K461DRAFT_268264 [Myriangium duriaei CBS 260.36]
MRLYHIALLVLAPLALAEKLPNYCCVDQVDKFNNLLWSDQAEDCHRNGIQSESCCVVAAAARWTSPSSTERFRDRLQPEKCDDAAADERGHFSSSKVDHWSCTCDPGLTRKHLDSKVANQFLKGLDTNMFASTNKSPATWYFSGGGVIVYCQWLG